MQSAVASQVRRAGQFRQGLGALTGCALSVLQLTAASCARQTPVTIPPTAVGLPASPASPSPPNPLAALHQDIAAATSLPGVRRGAWGIAVHSLDRDQRLFELDPDTLLVPASSAKIVSIAAASETVGWNFRYETTLRATGPIVEGVLRGDLIAVGSGDPSIGGRAGDDLTRWVDALVALGLRRIDGRIIGDDDALEEPRPQLAWAWDDLGYTAGAIFGALNLAENRMVVTVGPGAAEGLRATMSVEPHAAYRPLANRTITVPAGSMQLLWAEQRPGEVSLTIAGNIPAGAGPARLTVSVGNPTFWFASALRYHLLHAGIDVTGDAYDIDDAMPRPDSAAAPVIFTHQSQTLAAIAQPALKESINLYAEAALRLTASPGVFPSNDAALEGLQWRLDAWGVPRDGQQLIDGSGLSRRNVISAEALLVVLRRVHDASGTSPLMTALPVAGVDGSLATRMRGTPAERNVRAKTGTMSNNRSLAGFVTSLDGERLAFVVIVNNFEGTGAEAIAAIDAIAVRLASFSRSAAPAPAFRPEPR